MTNKVIKFHDDLKVINIGLEGFAQDIKQQGVKVVEVDWRPPADGQENLIEILKNINYNQDLVERINSANKMVIERIQNSNPQVIDILPAGEGNETADVYNTAFRSTNLLG